MRAASFPRRVMAGVTRAFRYLLNDGASSAWARSLAMTCGRAASAKDSSRRRSWASSRAAGDENQEDERREEKQETRHGRMGHYGTPAGGRWRA